MGPSLAKLLEDRGDVAFPHAPATADALLVLFRSKDGSDQVTRSLVTLVRGDPGLAFNLGRLLCQAKQPLASGGPIDLQAAIERFNPYRAVAILAPMETVREVLGQGSALVKIYCEIAAAAVHAAERVYVSELIEPSSRELAAVMALGSSLGLLGLANLMGEEALPVLLDPPGARCEQIFGFSLEEFTHALIERYGIPLPADTCYPAALRARVSAACKEAYSSIRIGLRTVPASATT